MSEGPVYLHVGLKKTGTSYLQSVLRANLDVLERQGLSVVPETVVGTRQLVRSLRGLLEEGVDDPAAASAVDRLPQQLAAAPGDRVLVTDELLGGATADEAARLVAALGGREAHLVLTVRDLGRTIPSAWQQTVKSGSKFSYPDFLSSIASGNGQPAKAFWGAYDVPALLERWAPVVPADRVHVVLVPPPGGAPTLLLERFCGVLGLDPGALDLGSPRANESLGLAQAELLRRLNQRWSPTAKRRDLHTQVIQRGFAGKVLAPVDGERTRVPAELRTWVAERTAHVVEVLSAGGYHLVGDLAELTPPDTAFTDAPQEVDEAAVAEAATVALHALLEDQVARRERRQRKTGKRARGGRRRRPS